jgi:hypothetical protein
MIAARRIAARLMLLSLLLAAWPREMAAQFFALCNKGDEGELRKNVAAHAEHTFRLYAKLELGVYEQGPLPSDYEQTKLADVVRFLAELGPRRAAVLHHAFDDGTGKMCTWLVTPEGTTGNVTSLGRAERERLRSQLLEALDVPARARTRAPVPRGQSLELPVHPAGDREAAFRRASALLLPGPIVAKLVEGHIDTVVVVPPADFGAVPFPALIAGGRPLVELASIVVAPGFASLKGLPPVAPRAFTVSIVLGDPAIPEDADYRLPPLPGARAEALDAAQIVGGEALVGPAATRRRVVERARQVQAGLGLVYLATHGLADPINPLDGGLLWLADGRWTAREIYQQFPLGGGRPLVVLSACQTGLGKPFEVGTIGMARAWERAGAASVVMSLWRVDDAATRALMSRFLRAALAQPPDKALQAAMLSLRAEDGDPAHWASFAVFGIPEAGGSHGHVRCFPIEGCQPPRR